MRVSLLLGGAAALTAVLLTLVPPAGLPLNDALVAAQPPPPPPAAPPEQAEPGVDVQTRGPVHESFAQPGDPKPGPGPVAARKPPEPIAEEPPPERPEGDDVSWIGGYWYWDGERNDFIWISGVFRKFPPSRRWAPGYWSQEAESWRWTPGFWAPEQQEQIPYDPPPPETLERGPSLPAPDEQSLYVPGCWVYRETRYLWRPGFYIRARPNWVWCAPRHVCTPGGWVFVDGYWDYPLEDRGMLFAPVCFSRPVYLAPTYCYRPRFVVSVSVVLGSMFVCPHRHCYVYGDYYGDAYVRVGYRPWCDWGPRYHDPLFSYYRHHRPGWSVELSFVHRERLEGRLPRPPRTLVQQTTIVRNTTINNVTVNNTTINNTKVNRSLEVARPLGQVARDSGTRLTTAPMTQVKAEAQAAREQREAGVQRQKLERELAVVRGQSPEPKRVTLDAQKFKLPAPTKSAQSPETRTSNPPRSDAPPKIGGTNPPNVDRPRPLASPGNLVRPENPTPKPSRPSLETPKNFQPFRVEPPKVTNVPQPPKVDPPRQVQPPPQVEPKKKGPPAVQQNPTPPPPTTQRPSGPPPAPKYTPPVPPPAGKPNVRSEPPPAPKYTPPPAQPRSVNPPPAPKSAPPAPKSAPARPAAPPQQTARSSPAPARPAPQQAQRPAVSAAPRSNPAPAPASAPNQKEKKKQ